MGGHAPDFSSVIAGTPRKMPAKAKMAGLVLLGLGIVATAIGLFTQPERTSATFIINFMYWAGIAQGALMLPIMMVIVGARWGRPLKRLAEAMGLFMVPMYLLLIVFLLTGGLDIYEWTHWTEATAPPHKWVYLQPGFFIVRQVVGLGLLIVLDLLFIRASLRADMGVANDKLSGKVPAFWSRFIDGWKGEKTEVAASMKTQGVLAPMIAIAYSLVFTMVAVDLSMSLAPHWFANMFPAWYFMSCIWSGFVFLGIFSLVLRKWMGADKLFKPTMYHDLGKLTFGFTMFWGYTLFAQYLAIWYGNMTEEIGFILLRTELEPWASMSKVTFLLAFAVPFGMLLSRGLKKMPVAYMTVAGILAVGIWLERFMVIMPSVHKGTDLPLGIPEIGMTLGFLGMFILVVVGFLAKVPTVTFSDPFMGPIPGDVHVLPKSQAHAHH